MLKGRLRSESGVALVVALIVTLIAFVLATAVLADAFHVVFGSLQTQRRVTAIDVAEAGLNWYTNDIGQNGHGLKYLGGDPSVTTPWSGSGPGPYTVPAQSVQGGSFALSVTYSKDGAPLNLRPLPGSFPTTFQAIVTSVGTVGGTTRTLRAKLTMQPNFSSVNSGFSGMFICELGNRFTVTGENANIYLLGSTGGIPDPTCLNQTDLVVTSGQFSVSGNVWVLAGSANLTAKSFIGGDLWVHGTAQVGAGAGQAAPGGQCRASATPSKVIVCGDVTAAGGLPTVSILHGTVLGNITQCAAPCTPPTVAFPVVTSFDQIGGIGWASSNSLPGALTATKTKYDLSASCPSPYVLPTSMLLKSDTALVSTCGFVVSGNFTAQSANTGRYTLFLVTYHVPEASCSANHVTAFKNNVDATGVNVLIYNPCEVSFRNQVNLAGQIVTRKLRAQGQTTIAYAPIVVQSPTAASVSSFRADVLALYEL